MTRIMVARSEAFVGEREAKSWLDAIAGDAASLNEEVKDALALLNRALVVLREAAEDPHVAEVGLSRALSVRFGYGSGEQLADGVWTEARELPPPRSTRTDDLDSHRKVALELSGREPEDEEDG